MKWKASNKILGSIILFGAGAYYIIWLLMVPFFSYGLWSIFGYFPPNQILYVLSFIWGGVFSIILGLVGYRIINKK